MPQTAPSPETQALLDKVKEALRQRRYAEGVATAKEALQRTQAQKESTAETTALVLLGQLYSRQNQLQTAVEFFARALPRLREEKKKAGEAFVLEELAISNAEQGMLPTALKYFEQALALYRELGNRRAEASTLSNLGNVLGDLGQPDKALEYQLQALPLQQQLGDTNGEAATLSNLGSTYNDLGQRQKAKEYFEKALPLHLAQGNKPFAANTLLNLGNTLRYLGQLPEGQGQVERALALYRELGNRGGESQALLSLGNFANETGYLDKALNHYRQAAQLQKDMGAPQDDPNLLQNIGLIYYQTGQYLQAREHFERARSLFHTAENQKGEADILHHIGLLYSKLQQLSHAKTHFEEALALYVAIHDRAGQLSAESNLGLVALQSGQRELAHRTFDAVLQLALELQDKRSEAIALAQLGSIALAQSQLPQARDHYQRALALNRALEDRASEGEVLSYLGFVASQEKNIPGARAAFEEALSRFHETGDRVREAGALGTLGLLYSHANQLAQAEKAFVGAITLYEGLRTQLGGATELKSAFLSQNLGTYYDYLRFLLAQKRFDDAFHLVQKTKARSLIDLLAAGRVDLSKALSVQERQQEQALRQQADALNTAMVREGVENEVGSKKRFEALKAQLRQVEEKQQTLRDQLYARYPQLVDQRIARTTTLAQLVALLPPKTALLEYVVASEKEVYLFVVAPAPGKNPLSVYRLPTTYSALAQAAGRLHAACQNPRLAYRPLAESLYQQLITPAAAALAGKEQAILCPDGALWDIPFAALHSGKKFLAERVTLRYAYSATGLAAVTRAKRVRPAAKRTLLVVANPSFGDNNRFGHLKNLVGQRPIDSASRPIDSASRPIDSASRPIDSASRPIDSASRPIDSASRPIDSASRPIDSASRPIDSASRPIDSASRPIDSVSRAGRIAPLPGTQREADALKKRFPDATILTGNSAQESSAKKLAGQFRYLHFATHGFVNDAQPLLSALILAAPPLAGPEGGDGFLTARELFGLDLCAEMTVLSACNTARGTVRTGDGMIGLTWALFVAGCPTQVVSQWAVDDASTALLMERFYANLQNGKAAALRKASLSLLSDKRYKHPYYWAPFILMGDGR